MKLRYPTFLSSVVFLAIFAPSVGWGNGLVVSPDLTATGTFSLSLPKGKDVVKLPTDISDVQYVGPALNFNTTTYFYSNVGFTATVQANNGLKINPPVGGLFDISPVSVTTRARLGNAQLIANANLGPNQPTRGFRPIMVWEGNLGNEPRIFAFRPFGAGGKNVPAALYEVDPSALSGIGVDTGWRIFDGVYGGSGVVSSVISPNAYVLRSGALSGATDFYVDLNLGSSIIPMAGVGPFTQTPRGLTTQSSTRAKNPSRVNISGVYAPQN